MAGVYATIANNGLRVDPHLIARVVDSSGESVQARVSVQSLQVISREVARDLQHLALGTGGPLDGHDHFGLAGSRTGEDYPLHSWYVGAIPQLSVAAWSGGDAAAGGEVLWRSLMEAVIAAGLYEHVPWDGPARTGSDDVLDLVDDETTPDPDSEHCRANPDDPACDEADDECGDGGCEPEPQPTNEPPRDPTTQPPPSQDPTALPTQEPPTEPSEDPSDDGGGCWFIC
jgi:membrane peptidoglycan carboxypeptidase